MAEGTCTSCGILGGTMNMQQGVQVYIWKDARGKMLDNSLVETKQSIEGRSMVKLKAQRLNTSWRKRT